jgi:Flp pilus assembly protein TadD
MRLHWIAVAALVTLAACTTQPPPQLADAAALTPEHLLEGAPLGVAAGRRPADPRLLAITDEMRVFLAEHVPAHGNPSRKIDLILEAILDRGLEFQYDNLLTLPAREAFRQRAGNCMSFTNLFLALAREAGLRAHYQEVMVPPTWTDGGAAWLYNLHVNVLVDLPGTDQVVDFNGGDKRRSYPRRLLGDEAGEARHHNNIGVHWMTHGDPEKAFVHFRRAIELQPEAGHSWTNLGTLFRREGLHPRAEAAFRRAIDLDREPVAMGNLARLYREEGLDALADRYERQVERLRARNPYYQFHLAERAYAAGDYHTAQRRLESALRRQAGDARFYHLLAMIMLQRGEHGAARALLQQARTLAEPGERSRYQNDLELLASG